MLLTITMAVGENCNRCSAWAGLPDSTEQVVADMFHVSVSVEIGNGQRALFWSDRWIQDRCIQELVPACSVRSGPEL